VLNKETGEISHHVFTDIIDYLNPGDVLAVNNSRVMPSRLIGKKEDTDGAIEFLLLKQLGNDEWETMVRPGKRAKIGARFVFGDGLLHAEVLEILEGGNRRVKFEYEGNNIFAVLEEVGRMPLPPYITEQLEDGERYQTVYNKVLGSAAAPTAGLHFTEELLQKIQEKGVKIAYLTLHVGLGTFRPVKVDDVTQHHMHSEHYWVSQEAADLINEAKRTGHRVIAARWNLPIFPGKDCASAAIIPIFSSIPATSGNASMPLSLIFICRKAPLSCWSLPLQGTITS